MALAHQGFQEGDIDRVTDVVRPLRMTPRTNAQGPLVVNGIVGIVPVQLLPFIEFTATNRVKSIFEKHEGIAGVNINEAYNLFRNQRWTETHPLLRPRIVPQIPLLKMQLAVVPYVHGTVDIVKHYFWDDALPVAVARQLIHGQALTIKVLSANPLINFRAFQWLFEQVGGLRVLWKTILPAEQEAEEMKAVDAGIDLIEANATKLGGGLRQLRWIMKQMLDDNSPLSQWKQSDIEKVFSTIEKEGALAKVRKQNPITLSGFDRFFLRHAIVPIIKSFSRHGLCMLGEPNHGKTPTALIIAFIFSRYYIRKYNLDQEPEVRLAPDLDFFRGQPGNIALPFILDDGDLKEQDVKKLKAFFDVGEEEASGSCNQNHYK